MRIHADRFGIFLNAFLGVIGLAACLVSADATAQVYPSNTARSAGFSVPNLSKALGNRLARRAPHPNDVPAEVLLASIPASHPLRSELRMIAQQPAPVGYSNAEWLSLAMKFDFRHGTGRPAGQLASRLDPYDDY